jgi:hypothetical protein
MTRQRDTKTVRNLDVVEPDSEADARRARAALGRMLGRSGARAEALAWFAGLERTPAEAWELCPRGDWLLRVACRAAVDRAALALAACACARFAWSHGARAAPGLEWCPELLNVAEAWARADRPRGRRRLDNTLQVARHYGSRGTGHEVVAATLYAVETVSKPSVAPQAALSAVLAVSSSASFVTPGSFEVARAVAHAACAELVRRHLPWAAVEAALTVPKGRKA